MIFIRAFFVYSAIAVTAVNAVSQHQGECRGNSRANVTELTYSIVRKAHRLFNRETENAVVVDARFKSDFVSRAAADMVGSDVVRAVGPVLENL